MDLQQLVHEDMKRAFVEYPENWGLTKPDKNIDHRRVPNLSAHFKRRGIGLPVSRSPQDYRPGDIVVGTVPPNLRQRVMKNLPGGVVLFDGHVYGYSDSIGWVCQDWLIRRRSVVLEGAGERHRLHRGRTDVLPDPRQRDRRPSD